MNSTSLQLIEMKLQWNAGSVVLSYVIAATGSLCCVQLMEQWRNVFDLKEKEKLLILASTMLGGCAIWAMHFTGMNALNLINPLDPQHEILAIDYDFLLTVVSLISAIGAAYMALKIGSTDPFFLALTQDDRKNVMLNDSNLKKMSIKSLRDKNKAARAMKIAAFLANLQRIIIAGMFASIGIGSMHFSGMLAQRFDCTMTWSAGHIILTLVIAGVSASAACWIIFRLLSFFPNNELLRWLSAAVMGAAVCITHYSGMYAATFYYSPGSRTKASYSFLLDGHAASTFASHSSICLCYIISSLVIFGASRKLIYASAITSVIQSSQNENRPQSKYEVTDYESPEKKNATKVVPIASDETV